MKKQLLSLLLSLTLLASCTLTAFANNANNSDSFQPGNAYMSFVDNSADASSSNNNSNENTSSDSGDSDNSSAITANSFKLIVQIPDTNTTFSPTTLRFNLFSENGTWLGNKAINVYNAGRYELLFPLEPYEIGTKFKVVATTGLTSFYYYGSTFELNEECIIETFGYLDEYYQPRVCTEGYIVATLPGISAFNEKEDHVNTNKLWSDTDYLIWVSKANFTVNVFLRNNGRWELIKEIPCSIGAPDTPTVTGQYKYYQYQTRWQYNGYYVGPIMRFYNGYAIHSTLINNNGTDRDNRVGEMISHGCVRVRPDAINWLVSYIPLGTKIYVTNF